MYQNAFNPRMRETSGLVPGQSRLRGRSRRHPSLATDAQAWARAVWTPCLPQPRPAIFSDAAKLRIPASSVGRLAHLGSTYARFAGLPASARLLAFRALRDHSVARFSGPPRSPDGWVHAVGVDMRGKGRAPRRRGPFLRASPAPQRRLRSSTSIAITLPSGPTGVSVAASRV